jgi:23S rRNA pseudouridine1911/1915/1917 synthase
MSKRDVSHKLIVEGVETKTRVDSYIAKTIENITRTLVTDKDTQIFVDGKSVKNSTKVKNDQTIEIKYTETLYEGIEGEDIKLKVLYEDDNMLVINKEQGLIVHPGANNFEHTLVNALVFRYGEDFVARFYDENNISTEEMALMRPGIVHRLDKDTSGTMVIALNKESQLNLSTQFKERETNKVYIALVKGHFTHRRGKIITNIVRDSKERKKYTTCEKNKGKTADTSYFVLKQYTGYALVRISIHTGRTHQIRVHFKSINHPVLGDPLYSNKDKNFPEASLMLHALQLEVTNPKTDKLMRFRAAMPDRFKRVIEQLDHFVREKGQSKKYYESAEKIRNK